MKKLAIIGAGDLGQLIAHHATHDNHYNVVGFVDDTLAPETKVNNLPVLGQTHQILDLFKKNIFDCLMIGIGYKHFKAREFFFEELVDFVPFATIIHSSAYVDSSAKIGSGAFILPRCTIDKDVTIGCNVLLNTATTIAHDTVIGNHSFLAPAVNIAGKVNIQKSCMIGINATVIDNCHITNHVLIGAGAVVVKSINKPGKYIGIPAKQIE